MARFAVLVLLVAASPAAADATWQSKKDGVDNAPRGQVLPVDTIATAQPGDWTIFEGEVNGSRARQVFRIGRPLEPKTTHVVWFDGESGNEQVLRSYVAGKHPIRVSLLGDVSSWVTDFKTSSVKCKLDRETTCTKVVYTVFNATTTLEMSPRVRGSGIVSLEIVAGTEVTKLRAVGYGRGTKSEWGVAAPRADLPDPTYSDFWEIGLQDNRRNLVGALIGAGWSPEVYTFPDDRRDPPLIRTAKFGSGSGRPSGPRTTTAAVPQVSLGQPTVTPEDILDPAIIRRYIKRNIQKIQYCYEKELLVKKSLQGAVTTKFKISENGNVHDATATGVDTEVAACVKRTIEGIEFPRPKGEPITVTYPFTFQPAGS